MPIDLQSYEVGGGKPLDGRKLLTDLRRIVDAVNKNERTGLSNQQRLVFVTGAIEQAAASGGGSIIPGPPGPPGPIGPFPPVYVDPNGAILGDGTILNPLRCSVDGVTITIVGNQLTVIAGGTVCEPLTDGDPTQPELIFAGGDVIMVCV